MFTIDVAIPLVIFGVVASGTYALLALFDPYWIRVSRRVNQLDAMCGESGEREDDHGWDRPGSSSTSSRFFRGLEWLSPHLATAGPQLQQRLATAGIHKPTAPTQYIAAKFLLTMVPTATIVLGGILGYLRLDMTVLAACVVGGLGFLAPGIWLDRAIAKHHLLLRKSLPDLLDLMTVCLEGGLSLHETIRRVSDELRVAHPALAAELEIVQRDIELGTSVNQALKRCATRTNYEGIRALTTFIREAQKFGTNITDALRSHADLLRSQREQAAEENAQKAAVKILLPTLFLIFPATFVVIIGPAAIQIHEAFAGK